MQQAAYYLLDSHGGCSRAPTCSHRRRLGGTCPELAARIAAPPPLPQPFPFLPGELDNGEVHLHSRYSLVTAVGTGGNTQPFTCAGGEKKAKQNCIFIQVGETPKTAAWWKEMESHRPCMVQDGNQSGEGEGSQQDLRQKEQGRRGP